MAMSDASKGKPAKCPHCNAAEYGYDRPYMWAYWECGAMWREPPLAVKQSDRCLEREVVMLRAKVAELEAETKKIGYLTSLVMEAFEEGFYAGTDNAETERLTGIAGKVSECFSASKTWSRLNEIIQLVTNTSTKGCNQ